MNRIAEFEKVSFEQFYSDCTALLNNSDKAEIEAVYNSITLPKRSTKGSAGYDFFCTVNVSLKPDSTIIVPTGIRCRIDDGWFLMCCPRSGLGFKYRLRLDNTVGIIDADYYNADNEGHIMIKLTNESTENKTVRLKVGDSFAQGIFIPFGITTDDESNGERTGGFGSTGS